MLFPWYIKYPNQNDEILNLDWILSTIDNLVKEVSDFVTLNTIKYADPIQWNITTQYEKNTVVIDPISGSAYISTKPVPAGVGLNNTDYWNIIFTLDVISANKNITLRDDANNMFATFESKVDDWLLWQGTLYRVTRDIDIGQAYVKDYNIERYTVEMYLKTYISNLGTYVNNLAGSLLDLETSDNSNLVAAINSVLSDLGNSITSLGNKIGDLDDLNTVDKSNVVAAINELIVTLNTQATIIGTLASLRTSDKTSLVGAINELYGDIHPSYKRVLTVGSAGCDYTTISAAITAANAYSTPTSRTAILITSGIYNEELYIDNSGIDLIGLGMPVVSSNSEYPHAPLEVYGSINVSNIYFINGNSTGSAYALHYEGQYDTDVTQCECYFTNCVFVSNANASVGIGSSAASTMRFINCLFYHIAGGICIYAHNLPQGSASTQAIEFYNCELFTSGSYCMTIDNARALQSGAILSPIQFTFENCIAGVNSINIRFNSDSNTELPYIPSSGEVYLSANSTGNNILGVNVGKNTYTLTQNIVMPATPDTSGNYMRVDFFTPFDATKYYRRIKSCWCNGADVTSSFSVESTYIDENKVGLLTSNTFIAGRYVNIQMEFSLDSQFR